MVYDRVSAAERMEKQESSGENEIKCHLNPGMEEHTTEKMSVYLGI